MYGDNIYHHMNGVWGQEFSHHSNINGSTNWENLNRDTQTDRVLIAMEFYYFGNNAIEIPHSFDILIGRRRNHQVCEDESLINEFISYISNEYGEGIQGILYSRRNGAFAHYRGK